MLTSYYFGVILYIVGDTNNKGISMKEFMNYISHFYDEGTPARDLPPSKLVFTEAELQRAISKALMYHGIYSHITKDEEKNEQKKKEVDKA